MATIRLDTNGTPGIVPANVIPLAVRAPERLVGVGFRCWLTGFTTGDIGCWEEAWTIFSGTLGNDKAKSLLIDLSQFVKAVATSSERDIRVQSPGCSGFCRDECLAISMIAACQHGAKSSLCASASALVGSDTIGDVLNGAQTFACGLKSSNQLLSADSVCPATCALRVNRNRLI